MMKAKFSFLTRVLEVTVTSTKQTYYMRSVLLTHAYLPKHAK